MTIKEIANLAGVSTSTVSKIVNGKDENINGATRARVLKLVKEYNYSPYSMVKSVQTTKTFLLGILLNQKEGKYIFLKGVMDYAQAHGYRILVCESGGRSDEELKNIFQLCKYKVDGVLWELASEDSAVNLKYFQEIGIPVREISPEGISPRLLENCVIDFVKIGYEAADLLFERQHSAVACILDEKLPYSSAILEGVRKAGYDRGIQLSDQIFRWDTDELDQLLYQFNISGIICGSRRHAMEIYAYAQNRKLSIPGDISLAVIPDGDWGMELSCLFSLVQIPYRRFGKNCCGELIAMAEKSKIKPEDFHEDMEPASGVSIDIPGSKNKNKILVVGNINMDIIVNVEELPRLGKTVKVLKTASIPGGKGANQAVGMSRLGAEVTLIGKVGNDFEGSAILNSLTRERINIEPVILENNCETGKAYIHVQPDGKSVIAIYAGANDRLLPDDINKYEACFEHVGLCLIQAELPVPTIQSALSVSRAHQVKVILKPSSLGEIGSDMLEQIEYFVPNQEECRVLCTQYSEVEDQARYFLDMGAKNVIITLGSDGCYLKNNEISRYFEAERIDAIDTTGAADAFISAFAVFLNRGCPLPEAIIYANCAAGLSVSKEGVIPSLVDFATLEGYMKNKK